MASAWIQYKQKEKRIFAIRYFDLIGYLKKPEANASKANTAPSQPTYRVNARGKWRPPLPCDGTSKCYDNIDDGRKWLSRFNVLHFLSYSFLGLWTTYADNFFQLELKQ